MIKTVKFKDEGQDFLEWDIEYSDDDWVGKVIDYRPFQHETWIGTDVYLKDIHNGDCLPIVPPINQRPMTLIHPVESVAEK